MSKNQKLRAIAAQLPPLPKLKNNKIQYNTVVVRQKGSDILEKNPEAKMKDGSEINPKNYYSNQVKVPLIMDHFTSMGDIHRSSGADGVNRYIDLCFSFNKIDNPGIKF